MTQEWAGSIRRAADRAARETGVSVVAGPDWTTAGHGSTPGRLLGTMWHDTVTPYTWSDANLARLLRQGYTGLPGPIANIGIGSTGNILLVAAGRAYHAGSGSWSGIPSGNLNTVGIEVQNPGTVPWRAKQLEVVRSFVYYLHDELNLPASRSIGHKEWAPSRKRDPHSVDMPAERRRLEARLQSQGGDDDLTPEQDRMLKAVYRQLCEGRDAPAASNSATIRTRTWQTNAAAGRMERNLRDVHHEITEGGDSNTPPARSSRTLRDRVYQNNSALGRLAKRFGV